MVREISQHEQNTTEMEIMEIIHTAVVHYTATTKKMNTITEK